MTQLSIHTSYKNSQLFKDLIGSYYLCAYPHSGVLTILVHLSVVLLIGTARHSLHPFLIRKVPVDGLYDTDLKGRFRMPAKVCLDLGRINAIAPVMPKAIFHMLDEALIDFRIVEPLRELRDDRLHNKDVRPLIMTADVVDLTDLTACGNHINSLAVVFNIQPVTDLHTITIHRQLLMILGVVDHQRDELLRELELAVVVRTSRDVHRHSIGVMESFHEVISRGF